MSDLPILVVFDIDETLIQYINKKAYHYWEDADPGMKRALTSHCEFIDMPAKRQCVFFRTGLRKFLEQVKRNKRIKIAIWTYSEREYATDIAEMITKHFGFEENPFVFAYGTEDIEDHNYAKSLKQVWDNPEFGRRFNKFNSFLVDDRKGNVCHDINMHNGIIVQGFAPFGETKTRSPLTDASLERSINDDVFEHLSKIIKKILTDMDGCSEEDIEEAFTEEAVFLPKCMKRRKLQSYFKEFDHEDDSVQICSIGDTAHAADPTKGGRRKHKRTKHKRTKHKRTKHKRKRTRRHHK
jgi:hypothetical protein